MPRLKTKLGKLRRQTLTRLGVHFINPGVHAVGITLKDRFIIGGERGDLRVNRRRPVVLADILIKTHKRFSEHFRHRALGAATGHLHLEQAILRHHIAVTVKKTIGIIGVDMRHAVAIANDLDLCRGGIRQRREAPA
ncbi:hypothetical protein D3C72_622000 [compost metagenome]